MPKKRKNNKPISIDFYKIKNDIQNSETKTLYFQNYPALCEYLNLPVLTSDSKVSQLKQLSNLLTIQKKDDNSFIIENANLPCLDVSNKDLKNLTEFTILAYLLYQHQKNKSNCVVSLSYLAEMLGYITLKYKYFYTHPKELSNKTNISIPVIYEFFEKTNDLYNRYINNSLEQLEKYKTIFVTQEYFGVEYIISDHGHEDTSYTEFGDAEILFSPDVFKKCRKLTDNEKEKLLLIERNAFFETIKLNHLTKEKKTDFLNSLKKNNVSIMYYLFSHKLHKKYYALRHKKLVEELNLAVAYKSYNITYNYDIIYNEFKFLYSDLKQQGVLDSIFYDASSSIVDVSSKKLLDNTKKRHQKEKEQIDLNVDFNNDEKEKMKLLIDMETKEFKQMLDLLIYQEKNFIQRFQQVAKDNYSDNETFQKDFEENIENINKKNTNFKKRYKF